MNKFTKILSISILSGLLFACNNDDDDNDVIIAPPPATLSANLRIVHAVADAPTVNVYASDAILAGLENVDYQVASSWVTVDEGNYAVRVEANVPGGNVDVISATLTLDGGMSYDVLAVGSAAAATIEPLVIANDTSSVTAGNVRVQIVHAAPQAPEVDIYVTAPDTDLSLEQALATAAYKDFTAQVEVPAGDYQIRITPAGSTTVVFDSGTVALAADADLLIAATQNTGTGSSPVTLLVSDGSDYFNIWDTGSQAHIRVVHAVPDAPAVDIIANNALTLFDSVPFADISGYISVDAGDYVIDVAVDSDNSIVAIDDAAISLAQGKSYTAIANNQLANIGLDLLEDTPRSVATAAKVRIIHASPAAGNVDIYVTADGDISAAEPVFSGVEFTSPIVSETGYVELAEGNYVVTVTGAGSKDAAIETGIVSLSAGMIYTAIAIDGTDGPTLITADGLAPAFNANMTYNINLTGAQEVPMVDASGQASAVVEIDTTLPAFKITLDTTAITDASAAHVHDGDIGINGGVAFPLTAMGDGIFMLAQTELTGGQLAALMNGEWYLNVHTTENPLGEVRGQIVADTTAVVTFSLSGLQEIPQVMSNAMGGGYALFDTTDNGVTLTVVTSGLDDASAAHIHTGFAGVNGPVLVALSQDLSDSNVWTSGGKINLDTATAELLLSGGHYVNVHNPANPDGVIRGQITADNIEVYGVVATGEQEVPEVTTVATSVGAITLNTSTLEIIGTMTMFDISPIMGHIHVGASGVNGDVAIAFVDAGDGTWTVDAALDAASAGLMQAGELYTNFHTSENPSGEVRGQITLGF
ncbi:MAG: hypothetical protein ACI88A_003766 [Paraglaciecola sp.]|jgi:hypothetical protein